MSHHRFHPSPRRRVRGPRAATAALAAFVPLLVAVCFAPPALARLRGDIIVTPATPTTCDSVTIQVFGILWSSCYKIVDADISGPRPLPDALSPLPVYGFRIRVIVQEPNPLSELPCTAGPVAYTSEFKVGGLAPGLYRVNAVEYLVPWDRPSSAPDTSNASTSFTVAIDPACPPPPTAGCFLLDFRPHGGEVSSRFCDAIGRPGGEACLDIGLGNPIPVGGVQLEINLTDTRTDPLPAGTFTPKSVTTTPRTEGFQVAWEADGSKVKALLFSATGKTIPAGRGPILNVCYGISENAPDGAQQVTFGPVLVADPDGNEIPRCPTFAEESGWICVGSRQGCDVNGDGRSNILDIVRIARCVLGVLGSEACPDSMAADCNSDGTIDVRDVICCARRILASGGPDAPESGDPGLGTNFIGFDGPARWISPVDGRATILIAQDELCAGMQFRLVPNGPIRIRHIAVVEGGGSRSVEWAAGPDGVARAILYTAPPTVEVGNGSASAVSMPFRLEVTVEPVPGGSGLASLTLQDLGSATWAGAAAPTQAMVGTVELGAPGLAAPAVFPAKPNPFVTDTEIAYALPAAARVSLRVFDVRGRLVRVLVDADSPAGVQRAHWNGRDATGRVVAAGIYFVKLNAGGAEAAQRLLRLR